MSKNSFGISHAIQQVIDIHCVPLSVRINELLGGQRPPKDILPGQRPAHDSWSGLWPLKNSFFRTEKEFETAKESRSAT